MPIKPEPPTKEKVIRLLNELKGHYGPRNSRFDAHEQLYKLKFEVVTVGGGEPCRPTTAYAVAQDIINQVTAEFPQITVPRRKPSEQAQRQAEKLQAFLNAFWYQLQAHRSRNLLRDILFWNCVRGVYVIRVVYDADEWPNKPEPPEKPSELVGFNSELSQLDTIPVQKFVDYLEMDQDYRDQLEKYHEDMDEWETFTQQHCPIVVETRDPKFVYWEPAEHPSYVIEAWDRKVADVKKIWPEYDALAPKGGGGFRPRRDTETVEWVEYWDGWWHMKICGGSVVTEAMEHNYGLFPYIIGGGWSTPLTESDEQYHSIYYAIEGLLKYEASLLNQTAAIIEKYSHPTILVYTNDPDMALDLKPGGVNVLRPGEQEDIKVLEGVAPQPAVEHQRLTVSNSISKVASADVLQGQSAGGSPAYRYAMQAAYARTRFAPIEQSVQWGMQSVNELALRLIENVHMESIDLWGQERGEPVLASISPQDIKHYYFNIVTLKTVQPVDEASRAATGIRLQQAGMVSKLTASEKYASIERPLEEQDRIQVEKTLDHPLIQEVIAKRKAIEWGYGREMALLDTAEVKQAQAQQEQMGLSQPISPIGAPTHAPIAGTAEGQELEVRRQTRGQFRKGGKLAQSVTQREPVPFRK